MERTVGMHMVEMNFDKNQMGIWITEVTTEEVMGTKETLVNKIIWEVIKI